MNHKIALLATCTTMSLLAGAAVGANYPDAIASHDELDMQDIAKTMINSLHPDQQRMIVEKGGLGSEAVNIMGFTRNFEQRDLSHIPHGVTATEFMNMLLSDDVRAELSDNELFIINNVATLLDEGKDMPYMCFAPDANPKFAYTINELLDYQFVSEDSSRFQQGNRWSRTAMDGSGLTQGDPTNITYSFVPDGSFIPNSGLGSGSSTLFSWLDGRYGNTATWQNLFHSVFDRWSELTGITYVWEQNDDGRNMSSSAGIVGLRGDVRVFAFNYPFDGNGGVLAYNFFPNDGDMAIDAFDTFYNNTSNNSRRLRNVFSHELGHGLGMAHVCPSSSTKLMEPFVSTSYDGPQLDDTLNGQRHYGDPQEPNQTIATATDLGTFADSGFANVFEASIDDNSDTDFYKITLTDRAKITFAIQPNAAQYLQGPQTASCNSGTNTNYNTMHNLTIDLYESSNLITPVASVNATGTGGSETLAYDSEISSGVYYAIVGTASSTNNIQRYLASLFITALPPVVCPADLNGDGNLDFFDVSAFLAAFSAQTADGDFNNDGLYNFFDVSDFLGAFSAGCP